MTHSEKAGSPGRRANHSFSEAAPRRPEFDLSQSIQGENRYSRPRHWKPIGTLGLLATLWQRVNGLWSQKFRRDTPSLTRDSLQNWPYYDDEQIAAVIRVLRSGKVNAWSGKDVRDFEAAYAERLGVRHAIALANGSVSLDLALRCLDVGEGDEVIVTPRSFVASASCVVLCGARPVFADVDSETQNITPETIEPLITSRTKGIIPVHLAGWPCRMPEIMRLAERYGLWVVEDCAQAHGARIDGREVGTFGAFASFSFCQDKILTTGGEGGLLVTNDSGLWQKAWAFKDHGKDFQAVHEGEHPVGFRWVHNHLGTNFRMTNIAAAIGAVQLRRLDDWLMARARNAGILAETARGLDALRTPLPGVEIKHSWYRFYCFVRPGRLLPGWSRDRIMQEMIARGFPAFSGSCPEIYRERAFRDRDLAPAQRLPVARELGATSLAFLVDPAQREERTMALANCLAQVVSEATA